MYENNNTVSIDWKGLFIKIIIVALIVFAIFKGYEYFSNKNGNTTSTTNTTQLFKANLESLRQAGENYYDYKNYPSEGQTVMVTLGELVSKGHINELVDENGNVCSRENSYIALTNEDGQYKLKTTLSCGATTDFEVNTIGCECEENICSQNENVESDNKEETTKEKPKKEEQSNKKEEITKEKPKKEEPSNNKQEQSDNKQEQSNNKQEQSDNKQEQSDNKQEQSDNKQEQQSNVKTYTVTFDSNGGTDIDDQKVEKGKRAEEPTDPEKRNSNFAGWYYNGELWDFKKDKVTRDITLEAYYWETKTINRTVYSAAWDAYGTTYVTVTHKLRVPSEITGDEFKNQRIKKINNERTMYSTNDLYNHAVNHSRTFDYVGNGSEYQYNQYAGYTLGRLYNINVRKTYSYKYDTIVTWSGYVSNQCSYTIDGTNCNYGIVYDVVWEYQEFTD